AHTHIEYRAYRKKNTSFIRFKNAKILKIADIHAKKTAEIHISPPDKRINGFNFAHMGGNW
ncbi:MAG: hypothetical protein KIG57_08080, partial [Muribaculaceae bacterium]|nr:hypothetical protein [Muribaculaceae bacterium]